MMSSRNSTFLNEKMPLHASLQQAIFIYCDNWVRCWCSRSGSSADLVLHRKHKDGRGNREFNGGKTKFIDVIDAVANIVNVIGIIIVVAIPIGLLRAVTLTLAYSVERMIVDHAMVRKHQLSGRQWARPQQSAQTKQASLH
ncbi:hypothetical protein SLA2020_274000 [Shorea laevis]